MILLAFEIRVSVGGLGGEIGIGVGLILSGVVGSLGGGERTEGRVIEEDGVEINDGDGETDGEAGGEGEDRVGEEGVEASEDKDKGDGEIDSDEACSAWLELNDCEI